MKKKIDSILDRLIEWFDDNTRRTVYLKNGRTFKIGKWEAQTLIKNIGKEQKKWQVFDDDMLINIDEITHIKVN